MTRLSTTAVAPALAMALAVVTGALYGCSSQSGASDAVDTADPSDIDVRDTAEATDGRDTTGDPATGPGDTDDGGGETTDGTDQELDTADPRDTADAPSADADAGEASIPLVTVPDWQRVSAADDPLADHRPQKVDCPRGASGTETLDGEETLYVSTRHCNYLTAAQDARAAIQKGDELALRLWHFELTADESAEAHVALLLEGEIVWEKSIPIPSSSSLIYETWEAKRDYPSGARIGFHLHNHGANTWNLVAFTKKPD